MDSVLSSLKSLADAAQAASAVVAAGTFLVAVVSLWKSISEYKRGNALKRFEKFQQMRLRFEEDGAVKKIAVLLANDDQELTHLDYRIKEDFLGFYEDIAIMNQSNLIGDDMVHYMFGYYALRAYRSPKFCEGLNLKSPYWALFVSLCQRLEIQENKLLQDELKVSALTKRIRF